MTEYKRDLISRRELRDKCNEIMMFNPTTDRILDLIDNAPTVEITDYDTGYQDGLEDGLNDIRPQGEWVWRSTAQWCSECSALKPRKYPYLNFCPKCGADMRKGG